MFYVTHDMLSHSKVRNLAKAYYRETDGEKKSFESGY